MTNVDREPTAEPKALTRSDRQREKTGIVLGAVSGGLLFGGATFALAGAVTTPWLFIPAGALTLASGIVFIVRSAVTAVGRLPSAAGRSTVHIGLGATVHASARIEPGAVVEMGAEVHAGAVVQSGAVIRMGATVGSNATVESGAVIGWGATVEDGATVQRNASVGAGATVGRGATLAEGHHVGAGGEVRASAATQLPRSSKAASAAPPEREDGRARRIDEICDRLDAELEKGTAALRSFISADERSAASLRKACHELLSREKGLRREVSPELMARLDRERATLEQRISSTEDEQVRASLLRAAAALDEQREQRMLLSRNADRLDAELTRLLWSIESVVTQLVRARSPGGTGADPELERGLSRVREELSAVNEALEAVDHQERAALRPEHDDDRPPPAPQRVRG
jgi:carbonic anhydrase/acetyltransferase-like protein (isoleucine patch superfamily)